MKKITYLKAIILIALAAFLWGFPSISRAEDLIKLDDALRKVYPKATAFEQKEISLTQEQFSEIADKADVSFDKTHLERIKRFVVKSNGQIIGYAFEDTVFGKWGPIHFLLGLNTDGSVKEAVVLDYQEIRGRPVAKKRFLRQYKGKSARNHVFLKKDINGVTGATISSRSMTDGVRKLLHISEEIRQD